MAKGEHVNRLGIPLKYVSLIMLVIQTVGVVFMMRLSRTKAVDGPRYLNTTAVFFSEVLKIISSFGCLWQERGSAALAVRATVQAFSKHSETAKMCVPALLYTLQNNLLFVSLSNLSAAVYQVTYQLKILSTALLSVMILGKVLNTEKWVSLLMLTAGVALIQVPSGEGGATTREPHASSNSYIGLVAVLSACVTSGLSGVYLEKILKQTDASIWVRNIQLGLISSLLAIVGCYATDGDAIRQHGFTQGYSLLVWAVIFLQAVGGLVVAAVLKYADNIAKCFGNALSIVISCILSVVFLHEFTPSFSFAVGTFFVLGATALYSLGLEELQQIQARVLGFDQKRADDLSSGV